jgi:hypothetical protein
MSSRTKAVLYWVFTGLSVLYLIGSGAADLARSPQMISGLAHLGYPPYVATLLGIWKLLAVPALLAPGKAARSTPETPSSPVHRVREWAYAGIFFNLTGAAFSHLASGDAFGKALAPLVVLAIVATSWSLVRWRGASDDAASPATAAVS